jgi:hypothetical protein
MSQWTTIATYLDRSSADIAKGLLESADIPAQVKADDMGGNRPYLGYGPGVRLMVERQHEMEARQILEAAEELPQEELPQEELPSPQTRWFLRAQTLCFLSFIFPIVPNLISLYLMNRYRQSMIQEKSATRYMFLLIFNGFLILAYGLIIGFQWRIF